MANRKFRLNGMDAKFKLPSLVYVPLNEVEQANEYRQIFEIFLAIGLTFIGSVLSEMDGTYLLIGIICLGLAGFFRYKYYKKNKKMQEKIK